MKKKKITNLKWLFHANIFLKLLIIIDQQLLKKILNLVETICKQRKGFKLDKFVFEKIITNLISNAVRYTPNGGKVIIKTDLDDDYWYLIDYLIPELEFQKEEQKQIFEEFYRASNAKKFERVGTGLGMSIIKRMVEQENGEYFP